MLFDRRLQAEKYKLEILSEKVKALDPTLLLKRGYSITIKDGHALHDPKALKPGDEIETRLEKGSVRSIVQ